MDDEVGVHVVEGAADLSHEQRHPIQGQSQTALCLVPTQVLIHVLVGCVLANQVDVLFVVKTAVQFGDVGVVDK